MAGLLIAAAGGTDGPQIDDLRRAHADGERPDAMRGLDAAPEQAERKIEANPAVGLSAPSPYPRLVRPGRRWITAGRYWIAHGTIHGSPVIAGVYF
jgi:hypothetical protein